VRSAKLTYALRYRLTTTRGKSTVKRLVQYGATVYMGSRSEGKAMDAIEEIKKEAPEGDIRFVQMDLQKLETVVEVAKEIRR
jgi:NAD(P)-dependent dehydrogenase (short-subunit alcohol dehydrogenase family)